MTRTTSLFGLLVAIASPVAISAQVSATIATRIAPPEGFRRIPLEAASFGAWLREFPLRPGRPPVHLYDGRLKGNQTAHHAVLDVDVGARDLQQCADAVIRLRAEYLFAGPCRDEIRFTFTSGDTAAWADWCQGLRPRVSGSHVTWRTTGIDDDSYTSFRHYLDTVFTYAGSASLERELTSVANPARPEVGDVFIEGGFPGHAVIVVDVAENAAGERIFLLAQSYMPAQEVHVLRSRGDLDPWYRARYSGVLMTPEWEFDHDDLRRFRPVSCEGPASVLGDGHRPPAGIPSSQRSRDARQRVRPDLESRLRLLGCDFGAPIFIRIFKETRELEVWAQADSCFRLFRTYEICEMSGRLGPKTVQGDLQAPEGFYFVSSQRMNPWSQYHLSFDLGYPNSYDRARGRTGSALMVHGDCVSIGCFAMTDSAIEEIYTLADAALRGGQPFFRVHVFPFRMTAAAMEAHRGSRWRSFWQNLREGYEFFERSCRPPNVRVRDDRYVFEAS